MGNCPSGSRFRLSPVGFGCVMQCPADKGFDTMVVGGKPTCAYKKDVSKFVTLNMLPATPFDQKTKRAQTIEEVRRNDPATYAKYKQEEERFDKDFAVVYGNIEKDVKTRDAFQELQAAENVRDQNPQAYQDARVRYYTLVKGDTWKNEERERIARAETLPAVAKFRQQAQQFETQINQQQRTLDVVTGVKDKVLSIRDELQYSVAAFGKQLAGLKSEIQIQRRMQGEKKESPFQWLEILINLVLILSSIAVAFVLYRKFARGSQQSAPTYTPYAYGR